MKIKKKDSQKQIVINAEEYLKKQKNAQSWYWNMSEKEKQKKNSWPKNLTLDNNEKSEFNVKVHDFSANHVTIDISDILDIYKYLIKKHDIM